MFAPRGWLKRPVARKIYRTLASSDLFDRRWYRSTQVNGFSAWMDPIWHYLDYGAGLGLDPSPHFDTSHYVHAHHDVRASGLNPLFHYLEYGIEERRSPLRSVLATRNALIPESAELETFTSPQTGPARVTLVADSRSEAEHECSLAEMVDAARAFARKQSRILRLIVWQGSGLLGSGPLPDVVTIDARRTHPAPTFDTHENEIFLSTSSTTALSLRHVAPYSQLWQLSSGKSRKFVPWSSAPRLLDLSSSEIGRGIPRSGRVPLSHDGSLKTLILFSSPSHDPVNYLLALESLEQLFTEQSVLGTEWEVLVCGQGTEPLGLAGTFPVRHSDHVSREHLSGVDLAIMTTPDSELESWCTEQGIPVTRELSPSALSANMTGSLR